MWATLEDGEIVAVHMSAEPGAQAIGFPPPPSYDPDWYAEKRTLQVIAGQVVSVPAIVPRDLGELKALMLEQIDAMRLAVETGGLLVGGVPVGTDREDISLLNSLISAMERGFVQSMEYKTKTGPVLIDLAGALALAEAISRHAPACYNRQAALSRQVAAAQTVEELKAIDWHSGW